MSQVCLNETLFFSNFMDEGNEVYNIILLKEVLAYTSGLEFK